MILRGCGLKWHTCKCVAPIKLHFMRLTNVKRPHGVQELAVWTSNKTHPEHNWTKLGIHIHPCKNWFVTWIDNFIIEIERI